MFASQTCADLLTKIANDDDWKIFNDKMLDKLRKCRDTVEEFKNKSKFWESCFLKGSAFASYAKKTWEEHYILTEAAKSVNFEVAVKKLGAQCDTMQRMHQEFAKGEDGDEEQ